MKPIRKNPFQKLKLLFLAGRTCLACLIWFALVPALALEANRPAAGTVSGSAVGARRPNMIFIMADNLGNADLSYRGSDIKTNWAVPRPTASTTQAGLGPATPRSSTPS